MFWYRLNFMDAQKMHQRKFFMYIFRAYFIQKLNEMVYEYFRNKFDALRNLVPFVQIKNVKTPMEEWYFLPNCASGNEPRNT